MTDLLGPTQETQREKRESTYLECSFCLGFAKG